MKTLQPHAMTKKELSYFGKDGRLKIIKQWTFEGKSYSARRDTQCYITIIDDLTYYGVGNSGYDYCFLDEGIDSLAKKLGVMNI